MIVTDPYLFKDRFEYDPDLGFRARAYFRTEPGFVGEGDDGTITNQFGFNDRDYPLMKSPGVFRIVVVGDSFGWAGGLKANYTALLEEKFAARDGSHKVEVVNTGYPGTHTGEQLAMLKKFGLQYNPDLVVLGFFAGNDFLDANPNRKRVVVNGCLYDINTRHEMRSFGYPIIPHSRLWVFLNQRYENHRLITQSRKEAAEWAATTGRPTPTKNLPREVFFQVEKSGLAFFKRETSTQIFRANIEHIFQSLTEMDNLLRARGIKFVVAIYPDVIQVSPNRFDEVVKTFGLNREDYDLNLPQQLLTNFLATKQIPYIDLTEQFKVEEQKRELYLLNDPHWNKAGNELAADILFQYLDSSEGKKRMAR